MSRECKHEWCGLWVSCAGRGPPAIGGQAYCVGTKKHRPWSRNGGPTAGDPSDSNGEKGAHLKGGRYETVARGTANAKHERRARHVVPLQNDISVPGEPRSGGLKTFSALDW